MKRFLLAALLNLAITQVTQAQTFDHSLWNDLLHQHVTLAAGGHASTVDYAGMAADHAKLEAYLQSLSKIDQATFDRWKPRDQLALLINAYNAWTVELILSGWPDIKSIKDLGSFFRSPWSKAFIPLLGETRSLDDIEHELIRGSDRYQDPRVHFALNCASIGCPALRPEAYSGEKLNAQLQDQARSFLGDRSRNRLAHDKLQISPIFKWYSADFEKGWQGYNSVPDFLMHYSTALGLSGEVIRRLRIHDIDIDYTEYNWNLNIKQE